MKCYNFNYFKKMERPLIVKLQESIIYIELREVIQIEFAHGLQRIKIV